MITLIENPKDNIEILWTELESAYPLTASEISFESQDYEVWNKYFAEQGWTYSATLIMFFLVMNGETLS